MQRALAGKYDRLEVVNLYTLVHAALRRTRMAY
ncbi:hypothetical protein [Cupriavidus sp. WKF15]